VLGRIVRETDGEPLLEALIVLLDESGRERARTVSSPTGGFELRAPAAGLYRVRVQRIGDRGWETPPFHLAAGQFSRPTLRVPDRPFELRELRALARRPRCGMTLGDASVGATLLEAAQTALALAEAEATKGRRRYVTETYRRTVPEDGPPRDSVVSRGELAGWPIQSADPDSLRTEGFVQGQWPAPNIVTQGPQLGPTYFGPDARVLFTDWFLGTHCILIDTMAGQSDDGTRLVARFQPAKGTRSTAALFGSLVFDRATLALQSLRFQFAARPNWAPRGSGGGELRGDGRAGDRRSRARRAAGPSSRGSAHQRRVAASDFDAPPCPARLLCRVTLTRRLIGSGGPMKIRFMLAVAFLITACARPDYTHHWPDRFALSGGAQPGFWIKRVIQKQKPITLVADDGSVCRTSEERFAGTKKGAWVACDWNLPSLDSMEIAQGHN
jgi:hypothetical protein